MHFSVKEIVFSIVEWMLFGSMKLVLSFCEHIKINNACFCDNYMTPYNTLIPHEFAELIPIYRVLTFSIGH